MDCQGLCVFNVYHFKRVCGNPKENSVFNLQPYTSILFPSRSHEVQHSRHGSFQFKVNRFDPLFISHSANSVWNKRSGWKRGKDDAIHVNLHTQHTKSYHILTCHIKPHWIPQLCESSVAIVYHTCNLRLPKKHTTAVDAYTCMNKVWNQHKTKSLTKDSQLIPFNKGSSLSLQSTLIASCCS